MKNIYRDIVYKENTQKVHWAKLISISIVISAIVAAYFIGQVIHKKSDLERERNARYTIGFTTGRHKNFRSASAVVEYYYWVGDSKFERTQFYSAELYVKYNDGRYIVQFSKENPGNSRLLLDKPIVNMPSFPYVIWDSIPESLVR